MKKVAFLFSKDKKPRLFECLTKNLFSVFDSEILATAYDMDVATAEDFKGCDLVLPLRHDESSRFRGILPDGTSLLFISRAISKQAFEVLNHIAKGSTILVVNESYELSLQTANFLFELGLNNITWIPYDPKRPDWSRYHHINIAVTPNEEDMVPSFIREIINIGDRCIDTYSMVRIATALGLDSEGVNSRLLNYSQSVAEPQSSITKQYLDNFLKSVMFQYYVHTQGTGILFCDPSYRLIYANEKAELIFDCSMHSDELSLTSLFEKYGVQIEQDSFIDDVVKIGDCRYSVHKKEIFQNGVKIGYSLSIQDEKSIRDIESSLTRDLAKRGLQAKTHFSNIITQSPQMRECIDIAKKIAGTDYAVLIEGESGTGKELLAQAIHNASTRNKNPFVAINCAAMPESLLESELFGYEGGAFTGALRQGKAGLLEQANGGTLFLDEIGDMPPRLQALMLRALQEKQILRIGGSRMIRVDVRIISASNKRLSDEVAQKRFRADLYHRLNVLPLHNPPLRQRAGDISLLLKYYLGPEYSALSKQQQEYLEKQEWSGNVRQLQNFSNYFKTMHNISGFFDSGMEQHVEEPLDILTIIYQHDCPGHGIGRGSIAMLLKGSGIDVSDVWLRKELMRLQRLGYISIGRGRTGCKITQQGLHYLHTKG